MSRLDENTISSSFRMYLDNPQHLKVAKVLKKVEADRATNNGLTKNQFIIDAIEYYFDHCLSAEEGNILVTRKELKEAKQELREELQAMLRMGWMLSYPTTFTPQEKQKTKNTESIENPPDDTIMDLVSDWD